MLVQALTTFLSSGEGMWLEGDAQEVFPLRGQELLQAGLVREKTQEQQPQVETEKRQTKPRKQKLENK